MNIEGLMEAGMVKELWDHLTQWYCQEWGEYAHITREGLNQESAVRAELYRCRPPARLKNPILVHPAAVNDDVLTKAEVELAVW